MLKPRTFFIRGTYVSVKDYGALGDNANDDTAAIQAAIDAAASALRGQRRPAMKAQSAFRAWFESQFGPRPTDRRRDQLLADVIAARERLDDARELLDALERWEYRETAALYAWQARRRDK